MVRHNNVLPNIHLNKDWQGRVKTWFDQAGRKKRRRLNRVRRAALRGPNPTHLLRPAVRGQTNKYNRKIKLGRGFTLRELRTAGITSTLYARSIGIAIDTRRKDTSQETLNTNVNRLKDYLNRIILYPRGGAYDKKAIIKEATKERLSAPEAKFQNTTKTVIPLPQTEAAITWVSTKELTDAAKTEAYKTLRKEWKTQKGVYKRLEAAKKKKLEKATTKK